MTPNSPTSAVFPEAGKIAAIADGATGLTGVGAVRLWSVFAISVALPPGNAGVGFSQEFEGDRAIGRAPAPRADALCTDPGTDANGLTGSVPARMPFQTDFRCSIRTARVRERRPRPANPTLRVR